MGWEISAKARDYVHRLNDLAMHITAIGDHVARVEYCGRLRAVFMTVERGGQHGDNAFNATVYLDVWSGHGYRNMECRCNRLSPEQAEMWLQSFLVTPDFARGEISV